MYVRLNAISWTYVFVKAEPCTIMKSKNVKRKTISTCSNGVFLLHCESIPILYTLILIQKQGRSPVFHFSPTSSHVTATDS